MSVTRKKAELKKPVRTRSTGSKRDIIGNVEKWSIDEKIDIIEHGVTKSEVEEVKKETGLDYETLAHILAVTKATLHNKKGNDKFNEVVSERLLLLAEIYAYGLEVFGDKAQLNTWLVSNIIALGGRRPLDRLNTTFGMQEVKQVLGRIAYGVYS
jgi:putative toxin-antitoxin system antitoxin component (TIGR02293 family)